MPEKTVTVLVADDDPNVATLVSAILKRDSYEIITAQNGDEVLSKINAFKPDIVLLDLKMPGPDGYAICRRIRAAQQTRNIPVIILSGVSGTEAKVTCMDMGADDFITKPFDARELRARVERTLKRKTIDVSLNPLTRLPGSPSIEEETQKRLRSGQAFAFAYIDGDNFKAFNDAYGYARGDLVIGKIAEIMLKHVSARPEADAFAGHVGGDDFVLISKSEAIETLTGEIAGEFDAAIPSFYAASDREHGYIETTDRRKQHHRFPIMTLSIAVVAPEKVKDLHYAGIVEAAAELKRYAKNIPDKRKSVVVKDRRLGNNAGNSTL